MNYDPNTHHRRSIRLSGYDYSHGGAYFITICTEGRNCWLGHVTANGMMVLSEAGSMVQDAWRDLPNKADFILPDWFVVMPNHIHGILRLAPRERGRQSPLAAPRPRLSGTTQWTLGRALQSFKSRTTALYVEGVKYGSWAPFAGRIWQHNYYEHIIRHEEATAQIRQYIRDNPLHWAWDPLNPQARPSDDPPLVWQV